MLNKLFPFFVIIIVASAIYFIDDFPENSPLLSENIYQPFEKSIQDALHLIIYQQQKTNLLIFSNIFVLLVSSFIWFIYSQEKKAKSLVIQKKLEVEIKNKEMVDSINYAKVIQDAMLPLLSRYEDFIKEGFIFYRPKDIVSGDFYWFSKQNNDIYIAAADCTGHGVPGAFMTMLGMNILEQIIDTLIDPSPAEILSELNKRIQNALKQNLATSEVRDGMDIAICKLNNTTMKLEYAGAYRPLILFSKGELIEIKADRTAIGGNQQNINLTFENHLFDLHKGDAFYIFSDGFPDQFGGPQQKKFGNKRLRELLTKTYTLSEKEQLPIISNEYEDWKKEEEQIDDVLLIGIQV